MITIATKAVDPIVALIQQLRAQKDTPGEHLAAYLKEYVESDLRGSTRTRALVALRDMEHQINEVRARIKAIERGEV